MSFQSEQYLLFAFFVAYEISKQPLKRVHGDVVRNDAISDVQHDGGSATSNENIVNDEENDVDDMKNHTPKTRQRETLTQYARESLPATSRSSLDDEDMAKIFFKNSLRTSLYYYFTRVASSAETSLLFFDMYKA